MANKKQVVNLATGKSVTKNLTAAEETKKTEDEAMSASKEELGRPVRVKQEARIRILAKYPEWKQQNLTARAVELIELKHDNTTWTGPEQTEANAIHKVWDWVKSVRTASDDLEAQNPVPADFVTDTHWPPNPVLAGTVSVNATSTTVTGTKTNFDADFSSGSYVVVWANSSVWESREVDEVVNATSLVIQSNNDFTISGALLNYTSSNTAPANP